MSSLQQSQTGYLFVAGCPRSGTTALWRLLIAHPQICLGDERYSELYWRPEFGPGLFAADRFWDLRPGDTFYDDLDRPEYEEMRSRYAKARYVGDKIPFLTHVFPALTDRFGRGLRVVTIERDLDSVLASYRRRSKAPDDLTWAGWDDATAVAHWLSARKAAHDVADNPSFLTVQYDALLGRGQGLHEILDFLELGSSDKVETRLAELVSESRGIRQLRGSSIV